MKTKEAVRIYFALNRGEVFPIHVLRKVALALKMPLRIKSKSRNPVIYWPKELAHKDFSFGGRPLSEEMTPGTCNDYLCWG